VQYAGKENDDLEQRIDNQIAGLINLIERKYISTKSNFRKLDFAKIAQYFTLDVITDVAFGKPFGYIATDSDVHEYIKMTEDSMPVIMVVSVLPWLTKVLMSPVFKFLLPSEKDKLGFGKFMGYVSGSYMIWAKKLLTTSVLPKKLSLNDSGQIKKSSEICSAHSSPMA
jgi:hypothetical protein